MTESWRHRIDRADQLAVHADAAHILQRPFTERGLASARAQAYKTIDRHGGQARVEPTRTEPTFRFGEEPHHGDFTA
jgi:hypothetical protein